MIHHDQVAEMLYGYVGAAAAKPTHTDSPGPIPTVIPTPPQFQEIGETGHRTLWVVFALMVLSSGFFAFMSWNVPISKRLYHVITTLITITASLSYFAMASGHATSFSCTPAKDHHKHVPDVGYTECRQVFWGRYVDWAITTPLLLLDLSLLAGIDGAHTLMAVIADVIMVLSGLFASQGETATQRWGWYAIGCVSYLFVIWHVALHGARTVTAKGRGVTRLFSSLALFTFVLWTAYPIVWGIADGAHRTTVDTEILIYAVLDILAKPVFGLWLLFSHRSLAETNVDVGGWWSHGLGAEGRIRIGDEE
ncbi:Small subunit processome complex component [Podospora pseudoanserina]|uniref:Small subunit processome complex component n=1 Tax=Podospora pseudoanserina TaxID=2609844 RepID=A0ABR0I479_9PEZI|nr:Small subunit processome complex component [Podospora pseudoanserina]